jgi:hypothetical protein
MTKAVVGDFVAFRSFGKENPTGMTGGVLAAPNAPLRSSLFENASLQTSKSRKPELKSPSPQSEPVVPRAAGSIGKLAKSV